MALRCYWQQQVQMLGDICLEIFDFYLYAALWQSRSKQKEMHSRIELFESWPPMFCSNAENEKNIWIYK